MSIAKAVDEKAPWICIVEKLPLKIKYAVIDIETTGLDPRRDEIVAYGLAYLNVLVGCVRLYASHREFKNAIVEIVARLLDDGIDVYAWYCEFEKKFLGLKNIGELQLRPYEKKDLALSLGIPLITTGDKVPDLWERWIKYRDSEALLKILWRAIYDAYVEAMSFFRKKIKDYKAVEYIIEPVLLRYRNE